MVRTFGSGDGKVVFISLAKIIAVQVVFSKIQKQALRGHFWRLFRNVIKADAGARISSTVLGIYYRSSFVYLAMDRAAREVFGTKIGLLDKTGGL